MIPFAPIGNSRDRSRQPNRGVVQGSFGDIVSYGGRTVSIFGLVFGVAASTGDTRIVLVAG
jgi:hypothetical protein